MDQESVDCTSVRDTLAYPGGVALMYLDVPAGALTPEQIAFLLGNNPEFIAELMLQDEEEEQQWTADALDARLGHPDPLLFDASGGKPGLAEQCLNEARVCATAAQAKRAALQFLEVHPRPIVECPVAEEMDVVQLWAERLSQVHLTCDAECQTWPECCKRHQPEIDRCQSAVDAAVEQMRVQLVTRLAEHQPAEVVRLRRRVLCQNPTLRR